MKVCAIWPEKSGTNVKKSCYMFKVAPFGKTTSGQTRSSSNFSLSLNQKLLAGLSNCLLRIQRRFWKKKFETTKKTVSILNDKLLDFEQLLFVRVAKTAWYESIGTSREKYLQETMSHYFSFLQFWSKKFSVWCWNCILRVQRKSLISFFFGISVDISRILSNRFWKRMPEQHFMLSVIPFAKKDKKLQFQVVSLCFKNNISEGLTKPLSIWPGALFGNKMFLAGNLHYEVSNLFIEKIAKFEKQIPQCWRNCFRWARRNNVEKNDFAKENCLLTNSLPTSGWNFSAVLPTLLSAYSRIHFG